MQTQTNPLQESKTGFSIVPHSAHFAETSDPLPQSASDLLRSHHQGQATLQLAGHHSSAPVIGPSGVLWPHPLTVIEALEVVHRPSYITHMLLPSSTSMHTAIGTAQPVTAAHTSLWQVPEPPTSADTGCTGSAWVSQTSDHQIAAAFTAGTSAASISGACTPTPAACHTSNGHTTSMTPLAAARWHLAFVEAFFMQLQMLQSRQLVLARNAK